MCLRHRRCQALSRHRLAFVSQTVSITAGVSELGTRGQFNWPARLLTDPPAQGPTISDDTFLPGV